MKPKSILLAAAVIAAVAAISFVSPRQLVAQVRAALVRDVDHPARQPVSLEGDVIASGGISGSANLQICVAPGNCGITVPAGKRLVIESFTARASVPGADAPVQARIVTVLHQKAVESYLALTFLSTSSSTDHYFATHAIRIYADAGSEVRAVFIRRPSVAQNAFLTVTGYGYLVDLN